MKKDINTESIIKAAANASLETGIKEIDTKLQKTVTEVVIETEAERKKRFHDTKLLLKNYRILNYYYKHAAFDITTAENESEITQDMNTFSDESFCIENISKSCIKTKIVMARINKMLEIYEIMCKKSNNKQDIRRWNTINSLYISDNKSTPGELAKKEGIAIHTVRKDRDISILDLAALIFGVNGIQ